MRLFKVTTATGQVVYVYATSNAEAQRLAAEFSTSFSQNDGGIEVPVGSSETGAIGSPVLIQQNGQVVPLGAISATSPLLAFAALGGGTRSPEQIVTDFDSIIRTERTIADGAAPAGAAPVGGDFPIGGPTDPIIGTDTPGGFGVAFRNRLAQEGLGGLRGVGRGLQDPLRTIFETGVSGIPGATGGLFGTQEGREGFAQEDFISRALAGIRGGGRTIGSIASSIFGGQGTAEQEQFFAPNFATSVPGGAQNELAQARIGAELARLAARQQFGTAFAQRLPSAFDLVEEFRAQPQATGTLDFRDFLSRRTTRGFTR